MYSKSLFGSSNNQTKSLINPLGIISIPFINNETLFTIEQLNKLNIVRELYTKPLGNQNYDIPSDYLEYSELYTLISNLVINTQNNSIRLLLKITREGLSGAINAFNLNKANIELNIQNLLLTNKIENILTNKNDHCVIENLNKNITLQKTFTLAPIYSYYISIFGIPEKGQGFQPEKIQLLLSILDKYDINPYF
jgi:hypothetical protein